MFKYIFDRLKDFYYWGSTDYYYAKHVEPRVRKLNASLHDEIVDSFDPEELLSVEVNINAMFINNCIVVPEGSDTDYTIEGSIEGSDDRIVCHLSPMKYTAYLKVGETSITFNKMTVTKTPDGYVLHAEIPLFDSKIIKSKRLNKEKE